MTRVKMSQVTKTLTAEGWSPAPHSKKSEAGCHRLWEHHDGRKATVTYGLWTSTGQSSRGAGAIWGHFVTFH